MEELENKLNQLKMDLLDLTHIVKIQLQKSKQAIFNTDLDLAVEAVDINKRIEILSFQVKINCEEVFDLYHPVGEDLRAMIATVKINHCLREISLHSLKICRRLIKMKHKLAPSSLNYFKINKMYDKAIRMLYDVNDALRKNDTHIAGKTIKDVQSINKINRKSNFRAAEHLKNNPQDFISVSDILETISDIEVIGANIKNIRSGIIFYMEVGPDTKGYFLSKAV